jgi:hypothetical protein
MNIKTICILSGISLVLAIPTGWPYVFYIMLRWFIFATSALVALNFYKSKLTSWAFIFGSLSFLFNPIVPVYLNKSIWVVIDFIAAVVFFIAASSYHKNKI